MAGKGGKGRGKMTDSCNGSGKSQGKGKGGDSGCKSSGKKGWHTDHGTGLVFGKGYGGYSEYGDDWSCDSYGKIGKGKTRGEGKGNGKDKGTTKGSGKDKGHSEYGGDRSYESYGKTGKGKTRGEGKGKDKGKTKDSGKDKSLSEYWGDWFYESCESYGKTWTGTNSGKSKGKGKRSPCKGERPKGKGKVEVSIKGKGKGKRTHWRPDPPVDEPGEWVPTSEFVGKKSFAFFWCGCGKSWTSAHGYKEYGQGCQTCEVENCPHFMWQNEERRVGIHLDEQRKVRENDGEHDEMRCAACRAGVCSAMRRSY